MCGIFGIYAKENQALTKSLLKKLTEKLFILSEARGKESAGIAIKNYVSKEISVLKKSVSASELLKNNEYSTFINSSTKGLFDGEKIIAPISLIAHARLVTNGSQENNNNNQPVLKANAVAVHNGIITNVNELWEKYKSLDRQYEVDTEVLLSIFKHKLQEDSNLDRALSSSFDEIKGTASIGVLNADLDENIVATNNGSVYYTHDKVNSILIFASEKHILDTAIESTGVKNILQLEDVKWLKPGEGIIFNPMVEQSHLSFAFENTTDQVFDSCSVQLDLDSDKGKIINYSPDQPINLNQIDVDFESKQAPIRKKMQFNLDKIMLLKRCTKCILPETFPFIEFDEHGECNYCKRYIVKKQGEREQEFKELMKQYQSKDGSPDCIIPFSGGRDSSYGLHYIVNELGLKPITYTYDWGMVTDLARRNIARVCGKLGIENIIVSADIGMKRNNIRKNVEAWLKKPELGMIPLFMAGDKQFFYYVNQIKKQTGIKLDIWSTNILENTDFKVGFCNISPCFDKTRPDYLPFKSKVGIISYYLKNFVTNPSYLNSSIIDTSASFYSYYVEPRNHFYQLFDWIKWDEKKIEKTLFEEYDWEVSPDTTTTWRIGDGTAAFYNYIYYTVAGFSEFDTFRSNQIREGLITREEALNYIQTENIPRFESMFWYFDTIGVDMGKAVDVVNAIPKRYQN